MCSSDLVAAPITVSYNLSGVKSLQLSADTIAGIFGGTITKWDDAAIEADNPKASLPSTAITVVHRSDGSGTTANFTKYLTEAAPSAWTLGTDKIVKTYADRPIVAPFSIRVHRGDCIGLIGPNGAGKTTLISVLAGLVQADAGEARIMGYDVHREYRKARRSLGVVPQELVFDPFFTVRETLRIQSGYFGLRRNDDWIDEIIHHLDLTAKANTNMRQLSGGMKIGRAHV